MPNELAFNAPNIKALRREDSTTISAIAEGGLPVKITIPTESWDALVDARAQQRNEQLSDRLRPSFEAFFASLELVRDILNQAQKDLVVDVRNELGIKNRRTSTTGDEEPTEEPQLTA